MPCFMFDLIHVCSILSHTVDLRNMDQIKIQYNGMLKESGLVYDSNVGGPAFKFLLGKNIRMLNRPPSIPVGL